MPAIEFDVPIEQGATFKWLLNITDPDTNGALDLTTYDLRGMGRKRYPDAQPAFTFTCTILDQSLYKGQAIISLTDEQTAAIAKGRYVYDIELESSAGEVARVVKGIASVSPEATK